MLSLPFSSSLSLLSNLESLTSHTLYTSTHWDINSAWALWRDQCDHLWCPGIGSNTHSYNLGVGTDRHVYVTSQSQLFLSPDIKANQEQKAHKLCTACTPAPHLMFPKGHNDRRIPRTISSLPLLPWLPLPHVHRCFSKHSNSHGHPSSHTSSQLTWARTYWFLTFQCPWSPVTCLSYLKITLKPLFLKIPPHKAANITSATVPKTDLKCPKSK